MSETLSPDVVRLLDFDSDVTCEVRLGGKTYEICQSHRALMERIMVYLYPAEEEGEGAKNDAELVQRGLVNWREKIPCFAFMLGVDPDGPDLDAELKHLDRYLTWPRARRIFETWYTINDVLGFLQREGNALVPQWLIEEMNRLREARLLERIEQAATTLSAAEPPSLGG